MSSFIVNEKSQQILTYFTYICDMCVSFIFYIYAYIYTNCQSYYFDKIYFLETTYTGFTILLLTVRFNVLFISFYVYAYLFIYVYECICVSIIIFRLILQLFWNFRFNDLFGKKYFLMINNFYSIIFTYSYRIKFQNEN